MDPLLYDKQQRRVAAAKLLTDDALEHEIARLEAQSIEAEDAMGDLTPSTYAWLFVLQEERERRKATTPTTGDIAA